MRFIHLYPPQRTTVRTLDDEGKVVDLGVVDRTVVAPPGAFDACQLSNPSGRDAPNTTTPKTGTPSPFLRLEEAAAYVRCGKKRLLAWVRQGLLQQTTDPDGRRFFRVEDLDDVMSSGTPPPISPIASKKRSPARNRESKLKPVYPRVKPAKERR